MTSMGSRFLLSFEVLLFTTLMSYSLYAYAGGVGLPDDARPGAVRPLQGKVVGLPEAERPGAVRPLPGESQSLTLEPAPPDAAPPTPEEGVEVPSVIDRPFQVDEGDVIAVQKFRLLGDKDLSEAGVDIEAVHALLDEQRVARPQGFTIGQLQQVADLVTNYCRQQGLILAQAVVPVQTVASGVVDIQVFPGKLGRIVAEGNERYATRILEKPFLGLVGKPIDKAQIEAALLTLTEYPGLSVFGVFQPGVAVGTADIVLRVQQEKPFDVAFRVDDHGTQETGRNRFRTIFEWNNIMGFADRMTFTGQQTYNPANAYFMGLDYERFLAHGFRVGGFINVNEFDVGGEFEDSEVSSRLENQGLFVEKSFIKSRRRNFLMRFGLKRERSQSFAQGESTSLDRLSVFTLSTDIDSVDTLSVFGRGGGGLNFASLEFSQGIENFLGSMGSEGDAAAVETGFQPNRQDPDGVYASGRFNKLTGSFTRLQTLFENHSLLFRTEFQWSSDLLVPLEQYTVGGADNLRAFPSGQALWDRAWFTSFEWIMNAPGFASKPAFGNRTWGELLQFSIFYDTATGSLNRPLTTAQQGYTVLKGAGVGLNFVVPGLLESRLMFATELGSEVVGNERSLQIWGDFTYRF